MVWISSPPVVTCWKLAMNQLLCCLIIWGLDSMDKMTCWFLDGIWISFLPNLTCWSLDSVDCMDQLPLPFKLADYWMAWISSFLALTSCLLSLLTSRSCPIQLLLDTHGLFASRHDQAAVASALISIRGTFAHPGYMAAWHDTLGQGRGNRRAESIGKDLREGGGNHDQP